MIGLFTWFLWGKIHWNLAKIFLGVSIKSGRGNVKGSGIRSPPCAQIVSQMVLEKRLSVKKIAFLCQTLQKCVNSFFIFKKSAFLASGLSWLSLKAFASLRLQRKSHSSPEKCFFYLMKNAFTVFGVSSIRKILFLKSLLVQFIQLKTFYSLSENYNFKNQIWK